jgi:SpoIIAA-like
MIERLEESSGHVIGFRIHGKLSKEDYTGLFVPELGNVIQEYGKARLLLSMKHFEGWTLGGAWEDFFNAPKFFSIERMAVVVDDSWDEWMTWLFRLFAAIGITIRFFREDRLGEAWQWLRADDAPVHQP